VVKLEGRFQADLQLGVIISDLLEKSFHDIIDVEYTRSLEDDLDKDRARQDRLREEPSRGFFTRNSRRI